MKNGVVIRPNTIGKLKLVNSISLSSDDGLSMKERAISIAKFDPVFPRFLIPMHFFLEKNVIILILKLFFKKDMVDRVNSIKVVLDAF